MDLIAIAQQTGDVSPEAYQRLALRGSLQPPEMAGVEELLQRMAAAEAAANPFANGGGAAAMEASPSGGGGYAQFRPPAVIPPSMASPSRSQACSLSSFPSFVKDGDAACTCLLSQLTSAPESLSIGSGGDFAQFQPLAIKTSVNGFASRLQARPASLARTEILDIRLFQSCSVRRCAYHDGALGIQYFTLYKSYLAPGVDTMLPSAHFRTPNSMSWALCGPPVRRPVQGSAQ